MKRIIESNCAPNQKVHTKVGKCAKFEGTPHGWVIHDESESFPTDKALLNAALALGIYASGSKRIVPAIGGVTDYQVSGGDVKTAQEGFGPESPIGLNAKRSDYIINEGGLCLLGQLQKLNGMQVRIMPVDKNKTIYGTITKSGDKEVFRGFLATVFAARRENTGSQTGAIIFSVFYDADYENEEKNLSAIGLTQQLEGLSGVLLERTAAGKAKVVASCSNEDLTEVYGEDLAVPALYVDAAGENPANVEYNTATKELSFTPATGSYKIADAKTLKDADIEGLEGEEEYVDLT